MDPKTFFEKVDHISDIPTLPTVMLKVSRMLQDYDTSINRLSKTIERDQAMVSKILKLVNSAFYGFQSRIISIAHATALLGFNTVRNALVSTSVIDASSARDALEGFDVTNFWKHSVAVAVTSRHLAEKTRLVTPNDAFVAGLLHDIGKVVLVQDFRELFVQVWTSMREKGQFFIDAEKKLLPTNHAQIGGYLAREWQLPVSLIDAIRYHHDVSKRAHDFNLLVAVHVADIIANNCKTDSEGEPDFSAVHPEAAHVMGGMLEGVSRWYPILATEIESMCRFFLEEPE